MPRSATSSARAVSSSGVVVPGTSGLSLTLPGVLLRSSLPVRIVREAEAGCGVANPAVVRLANREPHLNLNPSSGVRGGNARLPEASGYLFEEVPYVDALEVLEQPR